MKSENGCLNVAGLGLALGIVWGVGMMLTGWISVSDWGGSFVDVMSSLYIGYDSSFWGGVLGGIWGFFDAGIGGAIFAVIYNYFMRKGVCKELSIHRALLKKGEEE